MTTINIIGKDKPAQIPSAWRELTSAQVQFIYKEYFYMLRHQQQVLFYDRLLCEFLPQSKKGKLSFKNEKKQPVNAHELAAVLFSWLWHYDGEKSYLTFAEVVNHLPELNTKFCTFAGPKDLLFDITFEEFQAALNAQNDMIEGDNKAIIKLAASLYHPKIKGKRSEYNEELISKQVKKLEKAPAWQLAMISHWFANCINYIQTQDIKVDTKIINFAPLFKKTDEEKKNSLGWQSIIFAFAKDGTFGNVKETSKTKLFDILLLMLDNYNQNEQLKKDYAKINSKRKK